MNRITGEQWTGTTNRTASVETVAVVAPDGNTHMFFRGRNHTPYDVATFVIKAAKLNVIPGKVSVMDQAGNTLWPSASETREQRLELYDRFKRATAYGTSLL